MGNRYLMLVACIAAAFICSSSLYGQVYYSPSSQGKRTTAANAAAKAAPRPATFDKHDFSGVWYGRNPRVFSPKAPPMTAEGQKRFNANKPSFGPRQVLPALGNDPMGRCDPLGYPRNLWVASRAFEFVQSPGKVIQTFEWSRAYREIWTGPQRIPQDPDPRWYGWAIGHWERDTLVINSKSYNSKNWLDNEGYPQSESMTLEERWTRTAYDTLELTMSWKDPEYYTASWISAKPQIFKLQLPVDRTILGEEFCVPSEETAFNENIRNLAGTGTKKPGQ